MIIDAIEPPKHLLYFSPVAWASYAQRPHYFTRHFLRAPGASVTWVDPYPTRLPNLADLRGRPPDAAVAVSDDRVTVVGSDRDRPQVFNGFQMAASVADQFGAERRTRVLYVEDGIAALLADYRASK